VVHPIERLRFVARAGWAGPSELAVEAAYALAELAEQEPAALLPACRRLLERNPGLAPLWWVAARVLCAGDPLEEADRCAGELEDDRTEELLEEALAGRRWIRHGGVAEATTAEVVVVSVDALGPTGMTIDGDDRGVLEAAAVADAEVWALSGAGRVLPPRLWQALLERADMPPPVSRTTASSWFESVSRTPVVAELSAVRRVAGPRGVVGVSEALAECDCPEPPELVARW